mmetsp:Transcript_60341/g.118717  ORF Transcript_60341/g.118717 Transcript_60341/m.118717 type:complete len:202 (-) Transcript_60341:339-944(-)
MSSKVRPKAFAANNSSSDKVVENNPVSSELMDTSTPPFPAAPFVSAPPLTPSHVADRRRYHKGKWWFDMLMSFFRTMLLVGQSSTPMAPASACANTAWRCRSVRKFTWPKRRMHKGSRLRRIMSFSLSCSGVSAVWQVMGNLLKKSGSAFANSSKAGSREGSRVNFWGLPQISMPTMSSGNSAHKSATAFTVSRAFSKEVM